MRGKELLDKSLGRKLIDARVETFLLNGRLIDPIIKTYLHFGETWISIVSTDDMTFLAQENNLLEYVEVSGNDTFKYPIESIEKRYPQVKRYIGKSLLNYKELVLKKEESMSFGLNLYFEENLNWVIYNTYDPENKNQYSFKNKIPRNLKERQA